MDCRIRNHHASGAKKRIHGAIVSDCFTLDESQVQCFLRLERDNCSSDTPSLYLVSKKTGEDCVLDLQYIISMRHLTLSLCFFSVSIAATHRSSGFLIESFSGLNEQRV